MYDASISNFSWISPLQKYMTWNCKIVARLYGQNPCFDALDVSYVGFLGLRITLSQYGINNPYCPRTTSVLSSSYKRSHYLTNPQIPLIISSSFFYRIRFARFRLAIMQHCLVIFISVPNQDTFKWALIGCGAKKFVLHCKEITITHIKPKWLRFGVFHKTVLAINIIRFYKSLKVRNLFNQMKNHWDNVQIHVRSHEQWYKWEISFMQRHATSCSDVQNMHQYHHVYAQPLELTHKTSWKCPMPPIMIENI